jgi:hypothetical protein
MIEFTTQPGIDRAGSQNPTIAELIAAVEEFADSDAEVSATLRHLAATGQVRFAGGTDPSRQPDPTQ